MNLIFIAIFLVSGHQTVKVKVYEKQSWIARLKDLETDIINEQGTFGILSEACTCLIRRLAWENVVILFDSNGEHVVQNTLVYWIQTHFRMPVQMANIDSVDSNSSFEVFLYNLYHSVSHLNIILVAQFKAVSDMIRQVNNFDLFSNRTTDYRHRSKWIIVSEESVKENLTTWAKDLENVVFISSLDMNGHISNNLNIFTVLRSSLGPSISPVPYRHCNLTTDDIFPNIKYKFNGKQFLVVRTVEDPFSSPVSRNGTVTYEGYGIDILDMMAKHLNFKYVFTQPEDKQWGLFVNGAWTGIVGVLARREADLHVSSMTIHEDRARIIHFLQPPVYTQVVDVLYKRDDLYEDTWFTYIRQFKPMVFLCIGVSASVFCLLFVIFESFRPAEQSIKRTLCSVTWHNILQRLDKSVFFAVASVAQRGDSLTRTTSSSILVASWRLFLIVTTAAYTANLVAELTSQKPRVPFKTLGELVDNKDFTFGMSGIGIQSLIFKKFKSGDMKRAWTVLQKRAKTDPNILSGSYAYHIQRVLNGNYGWIISRKNVEFYRKSNCTLVFMNSPFNWQHVGFGVPTDSPYIKDFENVLSIISDNGLLDRLQKKWFKTTCNHEHLASQSMKTMGVNDVKGVFIFSAAGIGFALIILMFEVFCMRPRARCN